MKAKYADGVDPLRGKIGGFVAQSGHSSFNFTSKKKNDRARNPLQNEMMPYVLAASRAWQNLSSEVKTSWNDWAAANPTPARKNSSVFLTGYQIFIRRQTYRFIFDGFDADIVEPYNPATGSFPVPTINLSTPGDSLFIIVTFYPPVVGLEYFISASRPLSSGQYYYPYRSRLMCWCNAQGGSFNVTERYLSRFGRLPVAGEVVLFDLVVCGHASGEVFRNAYVELSNGPNRIHL